MTSPLDKIRSGILSNNMHLVTEGFEKLTGESLSKVDQAPDPKEDFIAPAQNQSPGKTRIARTEPIHAGENQFLDDSIEAKDVETPQVNPTKRTRSRASIIDVRCHICDIVEKIPESLMQGREFYRCDKCSRR
jgi:hypothetical protein